MVVCTYSTLYAYEYLMEDVKDDYRWYKGCVKHCKLAYENDKRERTIRTYYPLAHHPAPLKIIFQN